MIGTSEGEATDCYRSLLEAAAGSRFPNGERLLELGEGRFSRLSADDFETREYLVRRAELGDLNALDQLEDECWAHALRVTREELIARLERFPDGQLVLEWEGRVVGAMYSQRISDMSQLETASAESVGELHVDDGAVAQFLAVNVAKETQSRGWGWAFLEFMLQLVEARSDLESAGGVTLCSRYRHHHEIPINEYIRMRSENGRLLDPTLNFHESHGATIGRLVPGYRPADVDNLGYGVIVDYDFSTRWDRLRERQRRRRENEAKTD